MLELTSKDVLFLKSMQISAGDPELATSDDIAHAMMDSYAQCRRMVEYFWEREE